MRGWDHSQLAPALGRAERMGLHGAGFPYGGATALLARVGLFNRVAMCPQRPLSS